MQFSAPAGTLADALKYVGAAVDRASTIAILQTVAVAAASDGFMTFVATDKDKVATVNMVADVTEAGAAAVDFKRLSSLVSNTAPKTTVRLAVLAAPFVTEVTIGCCGSYRLPAMPTWSFSPLAIAHPVAEMQVGREQFADLLDVCWAASNELTRYYLNGVHIAVVLGKLIAVATNGLALCIAKTDAHSVVVGDWPGIIIPLASLPLIQKVLRAGDKTASVTLRLGGGLLEVACGSRTCTTKLIDSIFPGYDRIIPRPGNAHAETDTDALSAVVRRIATVAVEPQSMRLTWGTGSEAIILDASANAVDHAPASTVGEASLSLAPASFGALLDKITGPKVRIEPGGGPGAPVRVSDPMRPDVLMIHSQRRD